MSIFLGSESQSGWEFYLWNPYNLEKPNVFASLSHSYAVAVIIALFTV